MMGGNALEKRQRRGAVPVGQARTGYFKLSLFDSLSIWIFG